MHRYCQVFRWRHGSGRVGSERGGGRNSCSAGSQRVWQDHRAAPDRRARIARHRDNRDQRAGCRRAWYGSSPGEAPGGNGVPGVRAVPSHERERQHCLRTAAGSLQSGADQGDGVAGKPRNSGGANAPRAIGGPAAAGSLGSRPCAMAGCAPSGRAIFKPGLRPPEPGATGDQGHSKGQWSYRHIRHSLQGRGYGLGR